MHAFLRKRRAKRGTGENARGLAGVAPVGDVGADTHAGAGPTQRRRAPADDWPRQRTFDVGGVR